MTKRAINSRESALSRGSHMCYGRVDARRVAREFAVHVRARRTLRTDLSPPPHLSSAFRPRTVDKTHAVLSFHRFIAVQVRDSRARARRTTSGDTAGFARGVGRVVRWIRDATRRESSSRSRARGFGDTFSSTSNARARTRAKRSTRRARVDRTRRGFEGEIKMGAKAGAKAGASERTTDAIDRRA